MQLCTLSNFKQGEQIGSTSNPSLSFLTLRFNDESCHRRDTNRQTTALQAPFNPHLVFPKAALLLDISGFFKIIIIVWILIVLRLAARCATYFCLPWHRTVWPLLWEWQVNTCVCQFHLVHMLFVFFTYSWFMPFHNGADSHCRLRWQLNQEVIST